MPTRMCTCTPYLCKMPCSGTPTGAVEVIGLYLQQQPRKERLGPAIMMRASVQQVQHAQQQLSSNCGKFGSVCSVTSSVVPFRSQRPQFAVLQPHVTTLGICRRPHTALILWDLRCGQAVNFFLAGGGACTGLLPHLIIPGLHSCGKVSIAP